MLYELLILDTEAELKPYQFFKNGKCIAEGTATIDNLIKLYFEVYLCDVKFVSELGKSDNTDLIFQEIELDLANEGLAVGEVYSLVNHWKNKYILTERSQK